MLQSSLCFSGRFREVVLVSEELSESEGASETEHDGDAAKDEESETLTKLIEGAVSTLNLDLIGEAEEELGEVNWRTVSNTTFHVGVFGLVVWSFIIVISVVINYITSSLAVLPVLNRLATFGPLIPFIIFVFAIASRKTATNLENAVSSSEYDSDNTTAWASIQLGIIIVVALLAAGLYRWAMFKTTVQEFGPNPTPTQLTAIMIFDTLYLGLLLVALGGIGRLGSG